MGIADQLIETNPGHRRALVARGSQLFPVPEGFMLMEPRALWPLLTSRALEPARQGAVLAEYFVPVAAATATKAWRRSPGGGWGAKRSSGWCSRWSAGIYTADPEQLSLAATLPRFLEMERQHGGLIRAGASAAATDDADGSGARYSLFVTPRDGMQSLVGGARGQAAADSAFG